MTYEKFDDLPNHIRRRIAAVKPSHDLNAWVRTPIGALQNRSVLNVMNDDDAGSAEQKILQLLLKIEGYFG
jgi:hypothetical protein